MHSSARGVRASSSAAGMIFTEAISYQMPAFKDRVRLLVAYAAFKDHCSLFPMSTAVLDAYDDELKPFRSGKGTLRFHPDQPLPQELVTKIVKARIEENIARLRR